MAKKKTSKKKASAKKRVAPGGWPADRWDLYEDGTSPSLMTLFLACREQFRLSICEGWVSRVEPLGTAFGTCMHWCLERAYKMKKPPGSAVCRKIVANYEKAWLKAATRPTQAELERQERIYAMAEAVLPIYMKRWAGDWPGQKYPIETKSAQPKKIVKLETRYRVPLTLADGTVVPIVGTRDFTMRDAKGKLRIMDHKCYSRIDDDGIMDVLPVDLQQMTYVWAAWQEMNKVPAGNVLNVIRRPGQHFLKDDTLESWQKRIRADVEKPKRWPHYFIRYQLDITKGDLTEFENKILRPTVELMHMWWQGKLPHGANPTALINKYGKAQMFYMLTKGGDHNCYRPERRAMDYQTTLAN